MTKPPRKRRRLSLEILVTFAICLAAATFLYLFLTAITIGLVEEYCFNHDIPLGEDEFYRLDTFVFSVGFAVSAVFFTVLFLALFGEKLGYIRIVTNGVDAMREGSVDPRVPVKGNNELTELAEAVNYLAETQRQVRAAEEKLRQDREELIRSLSHDIRTPLTTLMSYTELLCAKDTVTPEELTAYLTLVTQKTAHMKELTDILLDGGRRNPEYFEDARLLFFQLCEELEEALEDFSLSVDLTALPPFAGRFDVAELRRVFDNLASNIVKYAIPSAPVTLTVTKDERGVVIFQSNTVNLTASPAESHRMGLAGIRRIAQGYGGSVEVTQESGTFSIAVILSDIL